MRLPYQKFIQYLILTKHTDKEITDILLSYSLPRIGNVYVGKLRDDMRIKADPDMAKYLAADDACLAKMHRDDVDLAWVPSLHMDGIHSGEDAYSQAHAIFSHKGKRNYVNIYLLCGDMTEEQICEIYERKFGSNITEECVHMYRDTFFDTSVMNPVDWQNYVMQFPPKLRVIYEAAPVKRSRYIQWKLGDHVDIDPFYIFNELSKDFFFLSRDAHIDKKMGWQDDAVKFANVALGASDRAARTGRNTGKNHQLELVKLVEQAEDMPDFDDLSEGVEPDGDAS